MSALGYCRRRGCGSPLVAKMDALGRVAVGCPMCARNRVGLCRDCPKPVRKKGAMRCAACRLRVKRALDNAAERRKYRTDEAYRQRQIEFQRKRRERPEVRAQSAERCRRRYMQLGKPKWSAVDREKQKMWRKTHPRTREQKDQANAYRRHRRATDPQWRATRAAAAMSDHNSVSRGDTVSAEQQARDMLERMGVEDAQNFSSGDLVELANLIASRSSAPIGCNCESHPIGHPHEARMFAAPSEGPTPDAEITTDALAKWSQRQHDRAEAEVGEPFTDEQAAKLRAWAKDMDLRRARELVAEADGVPLPVPAQEAELAKRFPVADVLRILADAADHLLKDHDCDTDGWELIGSARDAARLHLARLRSPHLTSLMAGSDSRFPSPADVRE
jgi:hypothetical protein